MSNSAAVAVALWVDEDCAVYKKWIEELLERLSNERLADKCLEDGGLPAQHCRDELIFAFAEYRARFLREKDEAEQAYVAQRDALAYEGRHRDACDA